MTEQRILVVDDDPGIRRTLQIGLSKAGYTVFRRATAKRPSACGTTSKPI